MDDLEQKLLLFDDLAPEEQAEVERYVRDHPEWASLLDESRGLHALLAEGRTGAEPLPDPTTLAAYVLDTHLRTARRTPESTEQHARVEAALRDRPELERQARQMLRTLEQLAAESEDPVAQFERLTGRHLRSPAAAPARAADRPATRPPLRLLRFSRLAVAACAVLVVGYGALALASWGTRPERARLADLAGVAGSYEGLNVRGASEAATPDRQYARALDRLAASRRTTLGLFPTYDPAGLDAAARDLHAVAEAAPDSWAGLEALYVLGRIALYEGRDAEAEAAFTQVIERQGPSAPEARRLLDWLRLHANAAG